MADYSTAWAPNPVGNLTAGSDYVTKLFDQSAQLQAGQQFAGGNYQGAASTLANRGMIDPAAKISDFGVEHFKAQHDYLQRAVPAFQQILQQHGPEAVTQAFDVITPDLEHLGVPPDQIANYRAKLQSDPAGTLQALAAGTQNEFQYQQNGDETDIFNKATGQLVGRYVGTKFQSVAPGNNIVQTGGEGGGAPVPASPAPAGGLQPAGGAATSPPPAGSPSAARTPATPGQLGANSPAAFGADAHAALSGILGTPVTITGGPRTAAANAALPNSSPTSEHVGGNAWDFVVPGQSTTDTATALAQKLTAQGIPFDQIIDEGNHVHVGFGHGNRGQILQGNGNGYTRLAVNLPTSQQQPPQTSDQPAQAPQPTAAAATPAGAQPPPAGGGARVVYQAPPAFRDPTPAEKAAHPGLAQVGANGEYKYAPSGTFATPATLSPAALDLISERVLSGDKSAMTALGYGNAGAANRAAVQDMVAQKAAQRNITGSHLAEIMATFGKATGGFSTGTQGNTVRSISVALDHMQTLSTLSNALQNGNTQGINQLNNIFKTQFGQNAPTNFNAAKQIIGDEIVKAIVGTGGAAGDREKAQDAINAANSPAQLAGVISTYQKLLAGQLRGLKQQYEQSTGLTDFDTKLSGPARALLNAPAHAGGQKVRIYNPATGNLE